MKLNFTTLLSTLFMLTTVSFLSAQNVNTLTITSGGTDTEINFGLAAYGNTMDAVSGTVALADDAMAIDSNGDGTNGGTVTDACESITNDVNGQIVVVDRGECFFGTKSDNGEMAGAIAVIICNSQFDPTTGDDISDNTIAPTAGTNGEGSTTTILTAAISYNDCQTLKMNLDAGEVTASFEFVMQPCPPPAYGPEVIWGANGEGAFDGGLNGWSVDKGDGTSLDDGGWFWDIEANIGRGAFGSAIMESPTACNGVMVFDSDFYDTAGEADGQAGTGFNDGVCISDPGTDLFCEGMLISPVIDMVAIGAAGAEFAWTQAIRQFQSEYYILISTDGGASYQDTIQVNQDLPTNDGIENNVQRSIPLCQYESETELVISFWYRGAFYYWAIDDVIIRNAAEGNVGVDPLWSSKYPNLVSPSGQYEEMPFMIDLENLGTSTSLNNVLNVEVINLTSLDTEYEATLDYDDIPCGTPDDAILAITDNMVLPERWTPSEDGRYRITYTVSADNDIDASNNSVSYEFEIGGDTFRKTIPADQGGQFGGIQPAGATHYSFGNVYTVSNAGGMVAKSCRFGIVTNAGAIFNGFIQLDLYEWRDLNNDGNVGGQASGNERRRIGTARQPITSARGEDYSNMEFILESTTNDAEIILEDNTRYIIMAHIQPLGNDNDPIFGLTVNGRTDSSVDFWASSFANDMDGAYWVGSYRSASAVAGDEEDRDYIPNLFGGAAGTSAYAVYLPLTIGMSTSAEELVNDQSIKVFPNPVSNMLNVKFGDDTPTDDVNFSLVNIQGQTILNKNVSHVNGQTEINVSNVPGGVYILNIRTEDGLISKKVVINN